MNDQDAFERQLSDTMRRGGRPSQPVDVAGIVDAATLATSAGRWSVVTRALRGDAPPARTGRGLSMFSAAKLVAAAAIVALFGGFLLSSTFSPPESEPVPAASPDALLAGMVTEVVEPGVTIIHNDGHRDVGHISGSWGNSGSIAVAGDDSIWVVDALGRYYRLGDEAAYDLADHFLMYYDPEADRDFTASIEPGADLLHGGPDGRLWLLFGNEIYVFEPVSAEWELWNGGIRAAGLAVDGAGTVWATLADELVRFESRYDPVRIPLPPEYDGLWLWSVGPDGEVLVLAEAWEQGQGGDHVLALREGELVPAGEGVPTEWPDVMYVTAGFDGEIWFGQSVDPETVQAEDAGISRSLVRLDASGRTEYGEADGIGPWGGFGGFGVPLGLLVVAPDGAVWMNVSGEDDDCGGVARFDGTGYRPFLEGHCIVDIDFTSDGDAWLLARGPHFGHPVGVARIDP